MIKDNTCTCGGLGVHKVKAVIEGTQPILCKECYDKQDCSCPGCGDDVPRIIDLLDQVAILEDAVAHMSHELEKDVRTVSRLTIEIDNLKHINNISRTRMDDGSVIEVGQIWVERRNPRSEHRISSIHHHGVSVSVAVGTCDGMYVYECEHYRLWNEDLILKSDMLTALQSNAKR